MTTSAVGLTWENRRFTRLRKGGNKVKIRRMEENRCNEKWFASTGGLENMDVKKYICDKKQEGGR